MRISRFSLLSAFTAVIKLVAKDIGQDAVDQYMNDVKDVLAQISKF